MQLNLIHRGTPLQVSTPDAITLQDLRHQISLLLSVPDENVRLLADGKMLSSEHDNQQLSQLFRPSQRILVLATKAETAKHIQTALPDSTVRPFNAKAPKYVAAPRKTHQAPTEYGFGTCVALPDLPDSDKALKILEQLACDRGFLAVMKKKRWKVGQLREMAPEGRVGVDPVCVLGYNTNKGQQIHLRLRTDDMKGFRAMYSIRQVLAHELAHNEFSEHDDNFKELMRWIEKVADRDNWRSSGQQLSDGWRAPDFKANGSETLGRRRRDGNMVGSESGSTGVSRLLNAYESRASMTKAVDDDDDDDDAEVSRETLKEKEVKDEDAKEGGEITRTEADDEEVRDDRESGKVGSNSESGKRTAVDEVMSLGFSKELASLAVRENRGDAIRAADWLLSLGSRGKDEESGEMGNMESETTRRAQEAVRSLGSSVSVKELISALEALHVYLSNVLRHGDVERYCRINGENGGFKRRVGGFSDAIEILRLAGFRLERGFWKYESVEVSRVWIVKNVVEERLLEELVKL